MEYLNKILGIEVVYENVALTHLPNFIATRYRLQLVSMNGQRAIFLYPATELEQIEVLKKHIARIQKNENLPVILVLKESSENAVGEIMLPDWYAASSNSRSTQTAVSCK